MKDYKFKKIDAFATINSGGNPAGCVWLDSQSDISKNEMQQIANELKGFVNEVGYMYKMRDNLFDLKFYSSEQEFLHRHLDTLKTLQQVQVIPHLDII